MILEIEPNIALDFLTVGKHVLAPGRACPGLSQPVCDLNHSMDYAVAISTGGFLHFHLFKPLPEHT